MNRNLINIEDLNPPEVSQLLELTRELKSKKGQKSRELEGKTIALLFQKPSNRTRVSFEVGIWQLGGNCLYLSPREIQLGERESVADVARTLSRFVDGIVARTNAHQDVVDLARYAGVPIINGLSDLQHPCQALADLFTILEKLNTLKGIKVAYVGDGNNNVCHSLIVGCALTGAHITVASPKKYEPLSRIVAQAKRIAKGALSEVTLTDDPQKAVKGARIIYADTFVSMGQEEGAQKRLKDLKNYQVNAKLTKLADKNYYFMHCLPAHRGQEVTEDIIDGPHSIIFEQAENRLHVQKAILKFLYK